MDEELIGLLMSGGGLEELRRRYGPLIRYVVEPILPDGRDAEECVSDVYMKVLSGAGSLDPKRPLKPWLTAVTRNAALSMARRKRTGETALEDTIPAEGTPEEELLRRERTESLKRALDTLSPSDRRLIFRKYYYRQPTAQIAAELGMTERAVEGKLYRLKKRVRELMGGEDDG